MTAETLAEWIKQSNRTVVLTGAGMSTESGIPDFRSSTGIWQKIDPRLVASTESLKIIMNCSASFTNSELLVLITASPIMDTTF